MVKKRVFVAINLPDNIKKALSSTVEKIKPNFDGEVRFLSENNWHLTISFLAYQDDSSINLICQSLEETAENFSSPLIEFEKIVYGPVGKTPRMIWLTGSEETSKNLSAIKSFLEKKLFDLGVRFRQEKRAFNAHLTLARFSGSESSAGSPRANRVEDGRTSTTRFETLGKAKLPKLDITFKNGFEARSLDLMESHLKRSGTKYDLLSKFDFSKY